MNLANIKTIKEILEKNQTFAKKYFGQNFLIDENILNKITETAEIIPTDNIIEVGPGLGVLTQELAKKAHSVKTIEIDRNIIPILEENLKTLPKEEYKKIEIINQDALKYFSTFENYKVVANIPYNITSPLITHFLTQKNKPSSLTLLVQKEVAEKLTTLEPDMTVLSLNTALYGDAKYIKKVPPSCFYPSPNVDSAIIKITIRNQNDKNFIPEETAKKILQIAKTAFSNRRKKLSNTLKNLKNFTTNLPITPEELIQASEKSHLDFARRPETLSVKEWQALAENL
ncbi:16S rRNA (adenine(1518)-N(6)/adenine(1519)-N(6))-dimethyltransferase RsmA [Candidatus Gracilibacteria bacterium]|nr:16S rRNA (adenine(1518)-N(6)/adenine(1519)-N(6))-dimethyltransferase RsmA [Candidatus Gracilibacteria bacterium]